MVVEQDKDFLAEFRGIKTTVVRWVWALMVGAFLLGSLQANLMWRLYNLESWKAEREKPIAQYYEDQKKVESRLATLESNSNNNADSLREIKQTINNLSQKIDAYILRSK